VDVEVHLWTLYLHAARRCNGGLVLRNYAVLVRVPKWDRDLVYTDTGYLLFKMLKYQPKMTASTYYYIY
jgi:hypothetical protein